VDRLVQEEGRRERDASSAMGSRGLVRGSVYMIQEYIYVCKDNNALD